VGRWGGWGMGGVDVVVLRTHQSITFRVRQAVEQIAGLEHYFSVTTLL
jgi:hypothetical protein